VNRGTGNDYEALLVEIEGYTGKPTRQRVLKVPACAMADTDRDKENTRP
jgi:hypothetical protein